MKIIERWSGGLSRRGALWWAVGLAVVLTLPSLATGFLSDDFVHRAALADDAPPYLASAPHDLYRFMRNSDSWREPAFDAGWLPWFTDPNLYGEFFRPLSSLTLYVDHRLWPESPLLAHAHSVAWYAALVLVVGLLFRRLLPLPWVGALAAILYAVDDSHGHTVAWIANRHALVSLFFAFLALLAHVRWRTDGWKPGAVIAPLSLLAGLFASESALAITAYLFAFALFIDRGRPVTRVLSLLPCAAVSVAWRVLYSSLGYGNHGMAAYNDPLHDPAGYFAALPGRLAVMLQSQLLPGSADTSNFFRGDSAVIPPLVAAVLLALVLAAIWPWNRRDRLAAFWFVGMVIAAFPACATFPQDRLLLPLGLGGMGLVAQLLARCSEADLESFWARKTTRVLAVVMLIGHVVLAPLSLPARSYLPGVMQLTYDSCVGSLAQVGDLEGRTLVIVRAPDFSWSSLYTVPMRRAWGLPGPERIRTLSTGVGGVRVTRVDESSLRLEVDGGIMTSPLDEVVRSAPFQEGERVVRRDMTVTVEGVTDDGRAARLLIRFDGGLEAPDRVFAVWSTRGYVPFELPEIGETVDLPPLEVRDLATYRYEPEGV